MASDSFTDTDETALATHDANWANANGDFPVANAKILSNQVRSTGAWITYGARYTASSEDLSQTLLISDGVSGGARSEKKVNVRSNGTVRGYQLGIDTTTAYIYKNGSWLATLSTGNSWPDTANHTLKVTASGTTTVTIEGFVDGVSKGTTTDSASPYSAANPGFECTAWGDAAQSAFDDWTDGAVAAGGPPAGSWMMMGVGV